jgi:hypothetical protein
MKKLFNLLLIGSSMIYWGCSPTSFATVGNNGWKVTLYHYSSDVKIQENGRDCEMVKAYAGYKKAGYAKYGNGTSGSGGYFLYTNGIQLDKSTDEHTITLIRGDKKANVTINRKSAPFIDVTAALGENKVMTFADLQKEYVKQQKKK